ncbi:MAG: hypothetical protein JJLCMIEE_02502 [Acidimicrobiales bacterium]|nr:MAG: TM0106 family RecB-like putative nuclease [Actinomycetota bacterium]MBV6509411.1 hypothetical protein [Acidimicrobiales bacterium]RIK06732.1 MAG: hypothetical protein DCC48_05775 [Acidobacteriota bacterium]
MSLTARLDVSAVPLQGAYVAKRCPVRAQNDIVGPVEPLPPSEVLQRRLDRGLRFEADVVAELHELHPGATFVESGKPAERVELTLDAMRRGAVLIVGGRLPDDLAGRRVGEPDLLIRASDSDGYLPVDIKHHRTLRDRPESGNCIEALTSELAFPSVAAASTRPDLAARKNKDDLLQLAHYRRMLQACGQAGGSGHAGIVGKEQRVVWYDLDSPVWKTRSTSERWKLRSTMEVYDFEFGFRLDIVATAQRHQLDPGVELLVVPVRIHECDQCPWRDHCLDELARTDDVSLLRRTGWRGWKAHADHGVRTRADLAALDWRTADLVAHGVDVRAILDELAKHPPATPIADIVGCRKTAQSARLEAAGINTAGDARALDPRTASYSGSGLSRLAEQIDEARAAISAEPVFRARGVEHICVPRADVEVDLDLESTEDGAYLWGALVTDRAHTGLAASGYRSFVTWEPVTAATELAVFGRLWAWLSDLRDSVHRKGKTMCVYCYNERVEADALRRLAGPNELAGVADLVTSDEWVDLLRITQAALVTGTGLGLKQLAPLAGFSWEDDDAGGEQSMIWHDLAVGDADSATRQANRQRILDYNRNDVEATLALRRWLAAVGSSLPAVADLRPMG